MAKEYRWGYIDCDGKMVVEPRFDGAWEFHEGLAAVKEEWARGYIDRTGAFVIDPRFQYAGPFTDGKALVQLDGLWGYVRPDGSWAEEPHEVDGNPVAYVPESGAPSADPVFNEGKAVAMKGKKYGYIDESGAFVIKPAFKQAKPFTGGLAAVLVEI